MLLLQRVLTTSFFWLLLLDRSRAFCCPVAVQQLWFIQGSGISPLPKRFSWFSLSSFPKDDEGEALSRARNDARTDVRNLLTQRAIQSFMFLCDSVRDPHSVRWLEEFLETRNQLQFHGTGAAYMEHHGGHWDGPLLAMMERPKDVVIVKAKRRGKGHGGWSKDNPYLEERFVEFKIDIDPVSLANRILSVREQIAAEWVLDLEIMKDANQAILASYFEIARSERTKRDEELTSTPPAFERTAVNILNNSTAFAVGSSSPFRKGNFDLLYNLCTQASVHRLLRSLKDQKSAKEVSFVWLRDFYVGRVADYFDGDQPYGRADDFVEDLLRSSPSVVYSNDGKAGLVDPMRLAEEIISMRSLVVEEWKDLMKAVPGDHADGIRRLLMNKQMQSWGSHGSSLGGESSGGGPSFQ